MDELISVIVPVYNTPNQYLNECINTILKNSYQNIEVIIVDDGSNYETSKFCDKIKEIDKRVQVIHQENLGVSVARNNGMRIAKGKYITFVDSDDSIDTDTLQTLYFLCEKYKLDFITYKHKEIHGTRISKTFFTNEIKILTGHDIKSNFLLKPDIGWHACEKFVRSSLAKNATFPEGKRTAEDMYFVWQLCKLANKIAILDSAFYNYRKNETSSMADKNISKFLDTAELVRLVWENEKAENGPHYTEADTFYISNEVWFLRFMIARGAKGEIIERLKKIRENVISVASHKSLKFLSNGRKFEFFLLKKIPILFYYFSKLQTYRMKE